jgi:murein DD-endopeptidase MepM/ murein hydrolase activator NlpD
MATRLTPVQIFEVLREAGFTRDQAVNFTAIAMAESGGNPAARLHTGVEDSRGLWQINLHAHAQYRDADLNDPLTNARAAYEVSNHGTNLRPWSVTHRTHGTPSYEKFLPVARQAAADAGSAPGHQSAASDAAEPSLRGIDHVRPIEDGVLTDTWHAARAGGHVHEGIDIFAKTGTPIHAVSGGTVVKGFSDPRGGVVVRIQGDDGNYYYYAHLKPGSEKALHVGQRVDTGDVIGQVGNSGDAATTPPHLHLQVKSGGEWVNPYDFLKPFPDMDDIESAGMLGRGGAAAAGSMGSGGGAAAVTAGLADPYAASGKPFVDSDHDGLADDFEKILGTNARAVDSDHDGLSDYQEALVTRTDALSADTDHHGEDDAMAVALGHDPGLVPLSPAARAALEAGGAAIGVPPGGGGGAGGGTKATDGDELTGGFETAVGVGAASPGGAVLAGKGVTGKGVAAKYDPNLGVDPTGLPGGTQVAPGGVVTIRQADGALVHVRVEHPDPLHGADLDPGDG